jgi:hypothetical protein
VGVGATVVCADWLELNSMWVAPTGVLFILGIFVCLPCFEYIVL